MGAGQSITRKRDGDWLVVLLWVMTHHIPQKPYIAYTDCGRVSSTRFNRYDDSVLLESCLAK